MRLVTRHSMLATAVLAALLSGCVSTGPTIGSKDADTVATGSAAGGSAQNANTQLEKCDSPLGTAALVEETSAEWYRIFTTEYKLGSTTPVLRLLMQQSNCFVVVERGRAFQAMERERQIAGSGQARSGSNFGGGQMVAADYSITPEVLVSGRNTSGMGGGLGGIGGGVIGAIAGGIRTNEAATMLTLIDNRSGVQIAASQGASKNTDFSLGGVLLGGGAGAGLGGYSNTPQGKVVVAAFTDAYNEMIRALRNYKAQQVQGQGLGTGGKLNVDGAPAPAPKPAPKKSTTTKKPATSSTTTTK